MLKHEAAIVINRPVDQVFAFMADLENAAQWQSGVVESQILSNGPLGVGTQFKEVIRVAGRPMTLICQITEYERAKKVAWKSDSSSAIQFQGQYTVEPLDGATRLSYAGETRLRGLWRLLEPLFAGEVKRELEAELKKVKSLVEAQAQSSSEA